MLYTQYRLLKTLKHDFRREDNRFTQAIEMVTG